MRIRTTSLTVLAVVALTVTGCSSNDDGGGKPAKPTTTSSAAAPPSLDQAAARKACKVAWKKYVEEETLTEAEVLDTCKDVPDGSKLGAEAIRKHNEANRKRLDDCLDDPNCTSFPVP